MINSAGVDLVQISEIQRLMDTFGDEFINDHFTEAEISQSRKAANQAEFLATRFAAKEAAFKAVAHFTRARDFDFRIVETLDEPDGYPVIQTGGEFKAVLDEAGITALHVSLAHEGDYAIAFVIAQR